MQSSIKPYVVGFCLLLSVVFVACASTAAEPAAPSVQAQTIDAACNKIYAAMGGVAENGLSILLQWGNVMGDYMRFLADAFGTCVEWHTAGPR